MHISNQGKLDKEPRGKEERPKIYQISLRPTCNSHCKLFCEFPKAYLSLYQGQGLVIPYKYPCNIIVATILFCIPFSIFFSINKVFSSLLFFCNFLFLSNRCCLHNQFWKSTNCILHFLLVISRLISFNDNPKLLFVVLLFL